MHISGFQEEQSHALSSTNGKCACISACTGPKLALIGVGGQAVATPQTRELAAKALVAAAGFVGPNDSATLKLLLRAMGAVVSWGAQEYRDAQNSFNAWRTDQDIAHDPAVSALLFTQVCDNTKRCCFAAWAAACMQVADLIHLDFHTCG